MKVITKIKSIVKKILKFILYKRRTDFIINQYTDTVQKKLKYNGIPAKKIYGEDSHIKKWRQIYRNVKPYSYRLFSRFMDYNKNIVPAGLLAAFIQPALNPEKFKEFYRDKNAYSIYIKNECLPKTVLCRMACSQSVPETYYTKNIGGGGY